MRRIDPSELEQTIWMAIHLMRGRNRVDDEKARAVASVVVRHMKLCGYEVVQPRPALDFGDMQQR